MTGNNTNPQLAEVLRRHSITDAPTWANERICLCGKTVRVMPPGLSFADHVAAVWRDACRIETVEQLLALPLGCIIYSPAEGAVEKFTDGHWYVPARRDSLPMNRLVAALPAFLVWLPEWQEEQR